MSAHYQTQPQPQLQLPHHMGSSGEQVAEGLTLAPPSGSNNGPGTGSLGGNNASREEWPLNQLDKIKSESRLVAVAGQNVVLNCAVQFKDGIEKPFVVNWLKYPSKLPIYMWYAGYPPYVTAQYENRVSRIGQASLNLSQVREQDQGLYECKIYHLHRQPDDKGTSTWIFLDVQGEYCHCAHRCPPLESVGQLSAVWRDHRSRRRIICVHCFRDWRLAPATTWPPPLAPSEGAVH